LKSKKLTLTESIMLVAGAGIGTGILTIPYAINKIGIWGTLLALALAYAVSAVMYLIIADLTLNSKKSNDLIGILNEHLFLGKKKKVLSGIFFVLLVLLLLENLVVYILCAASIMQELFSINTLISKVFFYIIASFVILFGVKGISIGEKFSVTLIGCVVLTLIIFSFFNIKGGFSFGFGKPDIVFALYGLFMFAFSAIFSIIQVCNNIEDKALTRRAVLGGLSINAFITILFAAAVIIGSEKVTEIAIIGLTESIGITFVKIICSVLVLLAMFSSFWSSGLAFADVIREQFKFSKSFSWFIATVPTIIIALIIPLSVLDFVQIGAGALSIILVIVVLPAYYNAVKSTDKSLLLGKVAKSKFLLSAIAIAIILMAVSSLVPIS